MQFSTIISELCSIVISSFNKWNVEYIDGCGNRNSNLYDIFWNLLLVIHGIRPAFMIQQIDYDKKNRNYIINFMLNLILSFKYKNNNIFKITYIDQGILVYLSKNISDKKTYNFVQQSIVNYNNNNGNDSIILGDLLGFPCSGDIDLPMSNKNRGGIIIYINKKSCIMANVCDFSDEKTVCNKINKFENIKDKLYEIKNVYPELNKCNHEFSISVRL